MSSDDIALILLRCQSVTSRESTIRCGPLNCTLTGSDWRGPLTGLRDLVLVTPDLCPLWLVAPCVAHFPLAHLLLRQHFLHPFNCPLNCLPLPLPAAACDRLMAAAADVCRHHWLFLLAAEGDCCRRDRGLPPPSACCRPACRTIDGRDTAATDAAAMSASAWRAPPSRLCTPADMARVSQSILNFYHS